MFANAKIKEHERISDLLIDENSDSDKPINCKLKNDDIHISSCESSKNTQEKTLNILNHSILQTLNETSTKYTQKTNYKKNGLASKLIRIKTNIQSTGRDEKQKVIKVIKIAQIYSRLLIQFSFVDDKNLDPSLNFMFLNESSKKFIKRGRKFILSFNDENKQVVNGEWNIYMNISKIKAVSVK